jgi:Zn-finger nucleic acid-binding protein
MICPNDSTEMHQVKITSHYGQPIVVDQCEECGGIWFDESELFRAKQGEAEKIESLDSELLRNPSNIENLTLVCPKDQAVLFHFTDKYFPEDIILMRCPSCSGIWLNRGQFTKYQRYRQELKKPKETGTEDKELQERVNQLIESYRAGSTSAVMNNLGNFLSMPLDKYASLPPDSTQRVPAAENAFNVALNILMAILRVFVLRG